jgi:hypothetical protein
MLAVVLPALALVGSATTGCNCYPDCNVVDPPPTQPEHAVRIWSGNAQVGPAGEFLAEDLVGEYRERGALAGVGCEFVIESGGGELRAIYSGATVSGTSVYTNGTGYCRAQWRLGAPGTHTVKLTFVLLLAGSGRLDQGSVRFTARGHGPATKLVVRDGEGQSGEVSQALPVRPRVGVFDADDNPVPGVNVVFLAEQGSGTPAGPVSAATTKTGDATLPGSWVLGPQPGTHYLQAVAVEQDIGTPPLPITGNPARLSATALAPVAARIEIAAGDNQTAYVGSAVGQPVTVRVTSASGAPVSGVTVDFYPNPTGVVAGSSKATDQDGMAWPTDWTLGAVPGIYTLEATARGANITNNPVRFTATALPLPAGLTLVIAAGNNQSGPVNTALPIPPAVRVIDAQGNGVAGIAISWSVAQGQGSFLPETPNTDALGFARLTYFGPTQVGPIRLVASAGDPRVLPRTVEFTLAGLGGASSAAPRSSLQRRGVRRIKVGIE